MKSTQIVTIALLAILFVHANATTGTLSGSYRKDFYLKDYHESLKSYTTPTDGGRVNLVLQGSSCNLDVIKSIKINSQEATNLPYDKDDKNPPDFTYFDWARYHSDK